MAAVAALVYLTGGLALQLRLGTIGLPSSAAVPQLPREFLISQGLLIVAPAVAVGFLTAWVARRLGRSGGMTVFAAIIAGAVCYAVIGLLVVTKDPFPARVCFVGKGHIDGVFIGETSNRTYLGELPGAHPRRILSVPQSQVARVIVGGRVEELDAVRCGG